MVDMRLAREAQRGRIAEVISLTRARAVDTSLVFVTNLRRGPLVEMTPNGIANHAQYYTEEKADTIIRSFQQVGFHVRAYFSEAEFMRATLDGTLRGETKKSRIVFTAAEGGSGAGRRALIPAFCRLMGLTVCNSGPHGCSIARHKFHASAILRRAGLPAPESWFLHPQRGWIGGRGPPTGARVIVKPTYESASIGIDEASVRDVDSTFQSYVEKRIRAFGQPATVQRFIAGRELGIPVIEIAQTEALPVMEYVIDGSARFSQRPRTFVQENVEGRVSTIPVSDISVEEEARLSRISVAAFEALDMSAVGRMDVRIDQEGRPWIFDTNEAPPPLGNTCYARSLETMGFDTADMLALWVGVVMMRPLSGACAQGAI